MSGGAFTGNGKIVSLMTRMGNRFHAPALVEGYWQALRGDGDIPLRARVDHRGIEDALEYAFIAERIAPGVARLRIAGTHLNDLMGMEVRGMPLSALFSAPARPALAETLEQVCTGPATAQATLEGGDALAGGRLRGRLFLAPLKSDFGEVNRILGCLQTFGRIGRTPRRLVLRELRTSPFEAPGAPPAPAASEPAAGFSEAPAPFAHAPKAQGPDGRRPALRLVCDND